MNILVLGGTGSIGIAVVKQLAQDKNNKIYVTSRSQHESADNIHYIQGNAHDKNFLLDIFNDRKYDVTIDFMSYKTEEFKELAHILLNNSGDYFFLSSSRVYADSHNAITELSPRLLDVCKDKEYLKTDEYALAKARQEDILTQSEHNNYTIIRPYKTYNSNRLQMGMYEKEQWLFRFLSGKAVPFPRAMKDKYTTLTFAEDVSKAICHLINRGGAYGSGEVYQIANNHPIKWEDVIQLYTNYLRFHTDLTPKVVYFEPLEDLYDVWNKYQIKYDCMFDRIFDCSKISDACPDLKFISVRDGIDICLASFMKTQRFNGIDWKFHKWADMHTGDHFYITDAKGLREKLRLLKAKYL